MEFNMLEMLTAQVLPPHMKTFGKGIVTVREGLKREIESHAPLGSTKVNILIISDLLYGSQIVKPRGIDDEIRSNPAFGLVNRLAETRKDILAGGLAPFLNDSAVSARWLKGCNEPTTKDPANFDLHELYAELSELSRVSWRIDRTVFAGAKVTGLKKEKTKYEVSRTSLAWDSNDPLPLSKAGTYDLIVMRRGLCYCGQYKNGSDAACCGAARGDASDVAFLKKIRAALCENARSAAYLGGWLTEDSIDYWTAAAKEAGFGAVVPAYAEVRAEGALASGIFVSRGRALSANKLKVK